MWKLVIQNFTTFRKVSVSEIRPWESLSMVPIIERDYSGLPKTPSLIRRWQNLLLWKRHIGTSRLHPAIYPKGNPKMKWWDENEISSLKGKFPKFPPRFISLLQTGGRMLLQFSKRCILSIFQFLSPNKLFRTCISETFRSDVGIKRPTEKIKTASFLRETFNWVQGFQIISVESGPDRTLQMDERRTRNAVHGIPDRYSSPTKYANSSEFRIFATVINQVNTENSSKYSRKPRLGFGLKYILRYRSAVHIR